MLYVPSLVSDNPEKFVKNVEVVDELLLQLQPPNNDSKHRLTFIKPRCKSLILIFAIIEFVVKFPPLNIVGTTKFIDGLIVSFVKV